MYRDLDGLQGREPVQAAPTYLIVAWVTRAPEYQFDRHNVGFMVGEELRRRHGLPRLRSRFHGLAGEGTIAGREGACCCCP